MKVLLISPPNIATEKTVSFISAGLPLGLAYLASPLKRSGFEVEILDALTMGFNGSHAAADHIRVSRGYCKMNPLEPPFPEECFTVGLGFEDIAQHVRETKPDIVGISSIFTSVFPVARELAKRLKAENENIRIVLGGNHPSIVPLDVLRDDFIDYLILGEGEYSFIELVKKIESGHADDLSGIAGVGYRGRDGKVIINQPELIKNLDELLFPDFSLLPMEKYFGISAEGRTVKMITSRGCTFNCCFCSVPKSSQRRFRARSPENVISEIDSLVRLYGIEGIMFEDDNMTLNIKRAKRIFELIIDRGYGLKLYARNFRADRFDRELATLMKRAGFDTIWITPESGNKRVLETLIDKKFKLEDVDKSVVLLREAGLDVAAAFVIGIPGETMSEIEDTINYARKLKGMGVKEFWFSIAQPIVGTRLYEDAQIGGLIKDVDPFRFSYLEGSLDTEHFKASEITEIRESMMKELNE